MQKNSRFSIIKQDNERNPILSCQAGGVCFNSSADLEPDYEQLYTITYGVSLKEQFFITKLETHFLIATSFVFFVSRVTLCSQLISQSGTTLTSKYFENNLRAAHGMCSPSPVRPIYSYKL